jgi:outer membrane usher protein
MSIARLSLLLCVSLATPAAADEAFVTQLRMPARETSVDTFAWRGEAGVAVERAALERLGVAVPTEAQGERVALNTVPGLTYSEDAGASAIIVNCMAACFAMQQVGAAPNAALAHAPELWGAFINYDAAAQWEDAENSFGAAGELNLFGPLGRGETTWLARTQEGFTRLETRWTIDMPERRLRLSLGDSVAPGVGGGVARFAGVQIGRHFGLDPSLITHPTPALAGQAEAASTVELYIDGALRAREHVQAGPFAMESAPFVTGAGEAQLVVTDALGRQQILSRPFFVSSELLRPGLSDWSLAFGVEREDYGSKSAVYGQPLAAMRYRRGLTRMLTAEANFDATETGGAGEFAATMAHQRLGQLRLTHAQSAGGAAQGVAYFHDARDWSFGFQVEQRQPHFLAMGRESSARRTAAMSFNVDMGRFGTAGFTAASADFTDNTGAQTFALAYTPELSRGGSLSFRLGFARHERSEFSFGLNFSLPLNGGVTSSYAVDFDDRGVSYRAAAQHAAPLEGGLGWRARTSGGALSRFDLGATYRGLLGDSGVRAAQMGGETGVRAEHAGAIGWVQGHSFAGRQVRGAFALVDAGAPNVSVMRDRLRVGRSGADGRVLIANLRPNETNIITIAPADLPLDQTPTVSDMRVTPLEGTGVVVRFDAAVQRLRETRVRYADGAMPLRGAVLVRARDVARFPVGSGGRVVLMGAAPGDRLTLAGRSECESDDRDGEELVLRCAA